MLSTYIETVAKRYKSGISSEHSYRADLESLIRELVSGVEITNEPSKVTDCGNPDYVITKGSIPIGFIEAKDLGKDLNSKQYKEQFGRYRKALDNLIITDYLWFQFFQNGELIHEIRIGEIEGNSVKPLAVNFDAFQDLIKNFCTFVGQTIKSPKKLAEMMAAKARLLETILERAVSSDEKTQENSSLKGQYESFKQVLIHDLTPKGFADIYAQTLAYGMFAARLHDTTLDDFSRQEAAELIPKTNPFLRKLFQYVAGYDIDERIKTTVDNLAEVFRATNVEDLLKNLGKAIHNNDPIIHFYETFLAEYDPKLRKSRGVWYTPEPVVNFIVRAVDDLLKSEFGLKDGLADTSKTTIQVEAQGTAIAKGKNKGKAVVVNQEVHKVQILDPATGTGTFLAEVVKFIYNKKFKTMQGAWSGYVEDHLIPRLNGFELLMASYSMAHLKLDMLLAATGYKAKKEQRFNIFLTNSLEEHHPDTGTLFSTWLSSEANEANQIKRDTPVMVVMGNPPYSVSSSNKGAWINGLMADYKKDLNEKNIQPLSDDYIKFIRYAQHFIDKNGEGILAYISNNSFIDGLIHRQMRKSLLESFDQIYILDLHGNAKKKETAPDGGKDENVFDIMQGVSINICIKHAEESSGLAKVHHSDVFGLRQDKYELLQNNGLDSLPWQVLECRAPEFFFVPKDFAVQEAYEMEFSVNNLFPLNSSGIKTHRDHLVIDMDKEVLSKRMAIFFADDLTDSEVKEKFRLKDNRDWCLSDIRITKAFELAAMTQITYRPFDTRYIYYNSGVIDFDRRNVLQHLLNGDNFALNCLRQSRSSEAGTFLITNKLVGKDTVSLLDTCTVFPLYLYPKTTNQQTLVDNYQRTPNLNMQIVEKIATTLGLSFTSEKESTENTFAPIDLLDYIYAVLHSPTYRENYKEFLKIDFPRVPYPKDKNTFWQLVRLGGELRQIHLLESEKVEEYITSYPQGGDNIITRKLNKNDWELVDPENQLGRIWINDSQYFDQIPLVAWEFFIGGYQPAQKWLKDRRGRSLSYEDIRHYQKIIVALTETARLMKEIDLVS
jgi:predicted helicase